MQGWRISMEDAHAAILDLQAENEGEDFKAASVQDRLSFFGVYDGHGGDKVAIFAGENVHQIIAKQEAFKRKDYEQAMKDGFLATDRAILNGMYQPPLIDLSDSNTPSDPRYEEEVSGCTASCGLITHDHIYIVSGSSEIQCNYHGLGKRKNKKRTIIDLENRQTLVTPALFLVSKGVQSHFLSIISHRTKVSH